MQDYNARASRQHIRQVICLIPTDVVTLFNLFSYFLRHFSECGGYLRATNRTQTFFSHPRFGHRNYKRNLYCNWRIQADPESSVKIKFIDFEVEHSDRCDYDSVEISEEQSYQRNANHGTYCGNRVIFIFSDVMKSNKSNIIFSFYSIAEASGYYFLHRHYRHTFPNRRQQLI